jgi:hypothetical protein
MGLFDTIRCEHPLPDGCVAREFQTKSLDPRMATYRLTADGHLLDAEGADTGIHGVMCFYTQADGGTWHEYEAVFTEGRLTSLVAAADGRFDRAGGATLRLRIGGQ